MYLIILFCKMDSLIYFPMPRSFVGFPRKMFRIKNYSEKGHVKCSIGHFDKPQNIFNMFETIFQCNFKCWFQIYIQFFLSCLELEKLQLKVLSSNAAFKYLQKRIQIKSLKDSACMWQIDVKKINYIINKWFNLILRLGKYK